MNATGSTQGTRVTDIENRTAVTQRNGCNCRNAITQMLSKHETYKLDCWNCRVTVEMPAGNPQQPDQAKCPQCGAALVIEWRPAAA